MKIKKIIGWYFTIMILSLFLTGCSNEQYKGAIVGPMFSWLKDSGSVQNNTNPSNKKKKAKPIATAYYENLSKSEKKQISFSFKLNEDETKDNTADYIYVVSMTIKNKSKKIIKFDKNKFIYIVGDEKNISKKKGIITIEPGKKVFVDQLFSDVIEQDTLGGGAIIYLNKHNILAYNSFNKNIATSDNVSNKKLQREFKELDDTDDSGNEDSIDSSSSSNADSMDSTSNTTYSSSSVSADNDTSSSVSTNTSSASSTTVIENSDEAIAAAQKYYGSDTYNGRTLTWGVMRNMNNAENGEIINGEYYWVKASDGTTMSGTTLSYHVYLDGTVVQQ